MNRDVVQIEHDRLGYKLGWRFMMSSASTLQTSRLAIVGLNPGGSRPHGPDWSTETGPAYAVESWGGQQPGADKLQRQVSRLCHLAGTSVHEAFAAQFVPFRSPSWADLARREEALFFARKLWEWTLERSAARTFVCLGKQITGPELAALLGARLEESVPVDWGSQSAELYRASDGRRVLAVPHLGRFGLMGRPGSERAVARLLAS